MRDFTELSLHARGKHHGLPVTGQQGGAGKNEVGDVVVVAAFDRIGNATIRPGLAGERRVIDPHPDGFYEPRIRRNLFTLFEQEDIAGAL